MEKKDYRNCIAELNLAYNQAKNTASKFNNFIQRSETVTLSQEEKRQELKELLKFKYISNVNRRLIKKILKGEISDRLFMQFYYPSKFNGISKEIEYYEHVLDGESEALTSSRTITIDINDVVSNPKDHYFFSNQQNQQLSNIIDISKYLYGEKEKPNMTWYIKKLVEHWKEYNNSHYFLNGYPARKTGPRYIIYADGSHTLNTMQLLRNSGLRDFELFLPKGFIDSLKHVNLYTRDNTPDDVDFILLFNSIHRLFTRYNITSEQFYIKDASEKGKNVISVEGKDISLSNSSELYSYARQVIQLHEHSLVNTPNSNIQQQNPSKNNERNSQNDNYCCDFKMTDGIEKSSSIRSVENEREWFENNFKNNDFNFDIVNLENDEPI